MVATNWIAHVKATHKKMGGTYKAAMKAAAATWKKKGAADHKTTKAKKKTRGKKKNVKFADDKEKEVDLGGAIRNPKTRDVPVDVKRIEMTQHLQPEVEEPEYETDSDEELGTLVHMGGRLSGRGAAYDPPDVAQSVLKSLAPYPEIAGAYLSGRVSQPRVFEDEYGHAEPMHALPSRDAGATVIDYGGSLAGISHSVDGMLHAHNSHFPHEFHLI